MMEELRQNLLESKRKVRQVCEEMRRRYPEYWKTFGFATEDEYLRYYDIDDVINQ
jgi:hypothetical protein